MPEPGDRDMPFYRDGRTATVTVQRGPVHRSWLYARHQRQDGRVARTRRGSSPATRRTRPATISGDAGHPGAAPAGHPGPRDPHARTAAVIGQGSGMSSHLLLGSPRLQRAGHDRDRAADGRRLSLFYPANRRAFDDPRSQIVIDDAKSYFASEHRRYDLIMSEPSNPWVSGVSGLFTTEFYGRVRHYLTDDGVFGQWLHVYELDDALVLSVLAALHQNFASYEVYLVPSGDLLVVASNRPRLPAAGLVGLLSIRCYSRISAASCRSRPKCSTACASPAATSWRRCSRPMAAQLRLLPCARSRRRAAAVPAGFRGRLPRALRGLVQSSGLAEGRPGPRQAASRSRRCPRTRGFGSARSERCSGRRSPGRRPTQPLDRVSRDAIFRSEPVAGGARSADQPPSELGALAGAGEPGGPVPQRGDGGRRRTRRSTPGCPGSWIGTRRPSAGPRCGRVPACDGDMGLRGRGRRAADRLLPVVAPAARWITRRRAAGRRWSWPSCICATPPGPGRRSTRWPSSAPAGPATCAHSCSTPTSRRRPGSAQRPSG